MAWQAKIDANDPQRASAGISRCSREAGFSSYQSTRLNRCDSHLLALLRLKPGFLDNLRRKRTIPLDNHGGI